MIFLLVLFAFKTDSATYIQQQHIFNHQTFPLFQNMGYGLTGGVKKFDSFAMNFRTNTGYRYRYEVYVSSRTMYMNQYRNTNVYGLQVFVNGQNISLPQYPYGLNFTATVSGTLVYIWETNDPQAFFNVTWQNLQ